MIFVRLTDEGRKQIVGYKKEKISFVNQMLHDFNPEELESLSDMLNCMQNNIVKY